MLSRAEIERMRAEHGPSSLCGCCRGCSVACMHGDGMHVRYPCSTARLLAHFAPGPVPHLAGIAAGLLGPVSSEELAR